MDYVGHAMYILSFAAAGLSASLVSKFPYPVMKCLVLKN